MANNNLDRNCDCEKCKFAFLECKKMSQEEKEAVTKRQQIDFLGGSEDLYLKVDNILAGGFDAHFAKESFKLYEWRENFFRSAFPPGTWVTDGNDDARMDAVSYNIACRFDKVVRKATLPRKPWERHYFESYEFDSSYIRRNFDHYRDGKYDFHHNDVDLNYYEYDPFQALQLLAVMFPRRPLRLEDLAIKKALEYRLPLDKFDDKIQYKAAEVRTETLVCENFHLIFPFLLLLGNILWKRRGKGVY